eukprot:scaffold3836_cov137-Skeletonema_menzelii.AAC.1
MTPSWREIGHAPREEVKKLLIPTEELMESCIQRELKGAGGEGKRVTFNGHVDACPVIDQLKRGINQNQSVAKKSAIKNQEWISYRNESC